MTIEELKSHAKKYSQTFKKNYGQWADDFESMALKTVTKLHLNDGSAPLTIDMTNAIQKDQASVEVNEDGQEEVKYLDNEPPQKTDPNLERQRILVEDAKTLEDIEFAEIHVTDETLIPVLKAKKIKIEKAKK